MNRMIPIALLTGVSVMLLNCSKGTVSSPGVPNISGPWEFLAASSTNTAKVTGIEVALKEGQVLVNGISQPNGQLSASGTTQIAFVSLDASTMNITGFGGTCPPSGSSPANDLNGSVSSLGGAVNFSYHEAGNLFSVTANLSGDGQSLTGTYSAQSGSNCNDTGTVTGTLVSKLSGTYAGQLVLPDGTTDTATATLSENSGGVVSVSLVLSGANNASLTLTGPVTARAFSVQGTFQGQVVSYYGYYELVYDATTQTNVPSLYFVNAANPLLPVYAGILSQPPA